MDNSYYTDEQNAQILLYLLKVHDIKRVIASPGATNVSLVASMQHDPFFEMYSCVDERSAAYMACGMAEESGEPVVLSCTGATSSRNYMPGLTEAFYRKLPILVVTSSMDSNRAGHLYAQFTDRTSPPSDCVKKSYQIQWIKDNDDKWDCGIKLNDAILELSHGVSGPVHVNLITRFSKNFSIQELPKQNIISRYTHGDKLPALPSGKTAIFVGQHRKMTSDEIESIESFCSANNAVVLADQTSNYKGNYRILPALIASQVNGSSNLLEFDTLIHIGEISGEYYTLRNIKSKCVWRVSKDGAIRDRFRKLTCVFEMEESEFFNYYSGNKANTTNYLQLMSVYNSLLERIPEMPFSTLWIAKTLSDKIPPHSTLYLSILNVLRSWNFFEIDNQIDVVSNVGGFGIDGMSSSLIGASLVHPEKLYFGITGDLNFFYDLNSLGNRHVGNNVRILMINNGHGQEFRTYNHAVSVLGEEADEYIAAARHFGNKSMNLVKDYARNLGFDYYSATNKQEFNQFAIDFVSAEQHNKPIVFEVFTTHENEYESLKLLQNIEPKDMEHKAVDALKSVVGSKGISIIKKVLK